MTNNKISILENDRVKLAMLVSALKETDAEAMHLISDDSLSQFLYKCSTFSTETSPKAGLIIEAYYLKTVYKYSAAYPNEKKNNWFRKDHGFKSGELRWLIPIDDLLIKVDELNSMKNAFLLPSDVVETVYYKYLPWKIRSEVFSKFGFKKKYEGKNKSIESIELFKFFQNIKNREEKGCNVVKTELDDFMYSTVNSIEIDPNDLARGLTAEKFLKMCASGDVDSLFIAPLYHKYRESDNELSEAVKLKAIFDLFRFIMKDRKWESEVEFDNRPKRIYDGVYDIYKTARVRKFIYKR